MEIDDIRADIASRLVRMRKARDTIKAALDNYDADHIELLALVSEAHHLTPNMDETEIGQPPGSSGRVCRRCLKGRKALAAPDVGE